MKNLFQEHELEAFIGSERIGDYDIEAIIDEVTEVDCGDGNRYWKDLTTEEINEICAKHDLSAADDAPLGFFEGLGECRVAFHVNHGYGKTGWCDGEWFDDARAAIAAYDAYELDGERAEHKELTCALVFGDNDATREWGLPGEVVKRFELESERNW